MLLFSAIGSSLKKEIFMKLASNSHNDGVNAELDEC